VDEEEERRRRKWMKRRRRRRRRRGLKEMLGVLKTSEHTHGRTMNALSLTSSYMVSHHHT
jgi:hypothetical protein